MGKRSWKKNHAFAYRKKDIGKVVIIWVCVFVCAGV